MQINQRKQKTKERKIKKGYKKKRKSSRTHLENEVGTKGLKGTSASVSQRGNRFRIFDFKSHAGFASTNLPANDRQGTGTVNVLSR